MMTRSIALAAVLGAFQIRILSRPGQSQLASGLENPKRLIETRICIGNGVQDVVHHGKIEVIIVQAEKRGDVLLERDHAAALGIVPSKAQSLPTCP